MKATLDQISATAADALEQAGGDAKKAVKMLTYEIENLPIRPALADRYHQARLEILRRERDDLMLVGRRSEAMQIAIQIDKLKGLY